MGKRILAADDSPSVRNLVNFVLTGGGYEVVEAVDGKDALAKLAAGAGQIKLIITDLNMPVLDGFGLIRAVRASAAHKHLPIMMVTTEAGAARKQEGRDVGATGWIVKPFTPDQLLGVVRKLIG